MTEIVKLCLDEDALLQAKQDSAVPEIVEAIKNTLPGMEAQWQAEKDAKAAAKAAKGNNVSSTSDGFYDSGASGKASIKVTDKETIDFLENQPKIKTYKSMLLAVGKLYPPMAVKVDGKWVDPSVLGQWKQAEERPNLIKVNKKTGKPEFSLNKEKGSVVAAYNPYMHSSDIVLNDQFTAAYTRNLVTVECEIPVSELTSGYQAQYAKDPVGKHKWHKGPVAGALREAKGIDRQVYMTRWLKPVRIVPNVEVAAEYARLLDGTGVKVPNNVVPAELLTELEKAGVAIDYTGIDKVEGRKGKASLKIEPGMSDDERYEILKQKYITVTAKTNYKKLSEISDSKGIILDPFPRLSSSQRKKLFQKIGNEFSVFKEYTNSDIELSFNFSVSNLRESLDKQGRRYDNYAKLLSCFDNVVESAIGIEVHNRNSDNYKPDPTLKNVYVLISAFEDGDNLIPVKLEVKEFADKPNTLYVAVSLESIKKDEVYVQGDTQNGVTQYTRSSIISIADLLAKVNPNDTSFTKYIPKKFFNSSEASAGKSSLKDADIAPPAQDCRTASRRG